MAYTIKILPAKTTGNLTIGVTGIGRSEVVEGVAEVLRQYPGRVSQSGRSVTSASAVSSGTTGYRKHVAMLRIAAA